LSAGTSGPRAESEYQRFLMRQANVYERPTPEVSMFREQMINFLQATVVFLLITNAFAISAAVLAIRLLNGSSQEAQPAPSPVQRKLNAMLDRAT
jgi:hypothetical protein